MVGICFTGEQIVGLMREVSDTVKNAGGKVTGIIPQCIVDRGVSAQGISELIVAPDMKERKSLMREKADAFIALPGGWGTLEEITEVITLKQLACTTSRLFSLTRMISTNIFSCSLIIYGKKDSCQRPMMGCIQLQTLWKKLWNTLRNTRLRNFQANIEKTCFFYIYVLYLQS